MAKSSGANKETLPAFQTFLMENDKKENEGYCV